jgi:hypothetical protein
MPNRLLNHLLNALGASKPSIWKISVIVCRPVARDRWGESASGGVDDVAE